MRTPESTGSGIRTAWHEVRGHSHSHRIANVYSKDALARPLRLLDEVLTEIREHSSRIARAALQMSCKEMILSLQTLSRKATRLGEMHE